MTEQQAAHFAEFIKDHDKRFESKARPDGNKSAVLLTLASDGTVLDPVSAVCEYQQTQIEQNDPGPTVKMAFDNWQVRTNSEQSHGG